MFESFKPKEYASFSDLYESLIRNLYWKISVDKAVKVQRKSSSVDDVRNPEGLIYVHCALCGQHFEALFVLDKSKEDDSNTVKAQVMALLEFFFDDHYQVSNKAVDPDIACPERDIANMKNIRDLEL